MHTGRGARGGIRRPGMHYKRRPFVPKPPFDLVMAETFFPRVTPAPNDESFTAALIKKGQDLMPTPQEQTALQNFVTKLNVITDALIVNPTSFESCQLEEVRQVGSFKKGTMRKGNNIADVVIVLKTLPTKESIQALGARILDELKKQAADPKEARSLVLTVADYGFEFKNADCQIRCLIATVPANIRKLEADVHMDGKLVHSHMAAVRHSRWFEENAHHTSVKVLVRLLRDLRDRFPNFSPLHPWLIDLLAHYAILNNPSQTALPLNVAYRRVLQLLAAGLFLPGSASIIDPCENNGQRVYTNMTLEQQDELCMTAQMLLRILSHGGYKQILGTEEIFSDLVKEMSVWQGIVVSPLEIAYLKEEDKNEDEEEGDEGVMETSDTAGI